MFLKSHLNLIMWSSSKTMIGCRLIGEKVYNLLRSFNQSTNPTATLRCYLECRNVISSPSIDR